MSATQDRSPTILLSAGEPSGDTHGAALARELRARWPGARLFGLGGPRMAAAGVELLADLDRLAVMGFAEVVRHLRFFARLLDQVKREIRMRSADLVIPIDYPGFNLRLAKAARAARVPVLYYIAPQVWAWHRSRLHLLAETCDRIAVVLPFEEALFREAGANAVFVGHPLLDDTLPKRSREDFCRSLATEPARPILGLFPGSRVQEVERHWPVFREAGRILQARVSGLQPVVARAPGKAGTQLSDVAYPATTDSRELLRHSTAAIVKSGTTTLEAALAGCPMVIAYRTHPLSYWLAKRLVDIDHIGLVNLVAGRRLAPELVQDAVTPAALARAAEPLLDRNSAARKALVEGLAAVRQSLQPPDGDGGTVAGRVADLADALLAQR